MYEYHAKVRRVVDGDTLDCDIDLGLRTWRMNERLRLSGINAPETRGLEREDGLKAKTWLASMLPVGTEIKIKTQKDDAFGRWIAEVFFDNTCINDKLVERGFAKRKEY